ncbi:diaminopimelate epimerase, partial [Candidatus Microgenomates bacterium]|nr:diaminopimelate epimerase [Candidatus Microgenomates bacterium]
NDYIVIDHPSQSKQPTVSQIQTICHRNFGVGSDGILYGPLPSKKALYKLRIFNPDGSEAEKSGNGIRIFSRYLYDKKLVGNQTFTLETLGGIVSVTIFKRGHMIQVDMGRVSFLSTEIPIKIKATEAVEQKITVGGRAFTFTGATIGNPHCVILLPTISPDIAKRYGPLLERHCFFPNRTNVQFMKIIDKNNIRLELWERGAGYTLSSGSLSSAAAAVAYKLGRCAADITAHMPGGSLLLHVDEDYAIRMTGPVTRVCEGEISAEVFTAS